MAVGCHDWIAHDVPSDGADKGINWQVCIAIFAFEC
jgi:hypothetical protein